MRQLIVFAVLAALPATADIQRADNVVTLDGIAVTQCRVEQNCVIVPAADLARLLKSNADLEAALQTAERERDMLRTSKGCAKVTPLPKNGLAT